MAPTPAERQARIDFFNSPAHPTYAQRQARAQQVWDEGVRRQQEREAEAQRYAQQQAAGTPPPEPNYASQTPPGFDGATYLRLNPDVAAAGMDPARHYIRYGLSEGRAFQEQAKERADFYLSQGSGDLDNAIYSATSASPLARSGDVLDNLSSRFNLTNQSFDSWMSDRSYRDTPYQAKGSGEQRLSAAPNPASRFSNTDESVDSWMNNRDYREAAWDPLEEARRLNEKRRLEMDGTTQEFTP